MSIDSRGSYSHRIPHAFHQLKWISSCFPVPCWPRVLPGYVRAEDAVGSHQHFPTVGDYVHRNFSPVNKRSRESREAGQVELSRLGWLWEAVGDKPRELSDTVSTRPVRVSNALPLHSRKPYRLIELHHII